MSRISSVVVSFSVLFLGWTATDSVSAQTPLTSKKVDSWDAVFMSGSKVGFIHTYVEPVADKGRDLLRVRVDLEMNYKRLNDIVTMKMQYGTIEELDGSVLRLDTRILAGEQETRIHGDVMNGKMKLTLDGTGQKQEQVIDWPAETRGPYAAEQSLSRKPIAAGEERTLKMYMPDLNRICDIKLTAVGFEEVKLGGNTMRNLMHIDQTTFLDGKPRPEFDLSMWTDPRGSVMTSRTDNLGGMVWYRTTEEGAIAVGDAAPSFDQIRNSVIKISKKLPQPETTRDVRYRITLKSENPGAIIPEDRRQTLQKGRDDKEIILQVKTAGKDVGTAGPTTVDPMYLRPNSMITSEDKRVVDFTRQAIGNETDSWKRAVAIEKWVAKNLEEKDFSVAFASASEVAQNLRGDCTEHGVLTAAMCRAAGVPARVVVGLIYAGQLNGFGFHMWNEVYVNRRWVAIDASFAQDQVDAVHIKLADASLDGVAPFEAFLPIVRVLGKMTIEPIEVR